MGADIRGHLLAVLAGSVVGALPPLPALHGGGGGEQEEGEQEGEGEEEVGSHPAPTAPSPRTHCSSQQSPELIVVLPVPVTADTTGYTRGHDIDTIINPH